MVRSFLCAPIVALAAHAQSVWPVPQHLSASGEPVVIASGFTFEVSIDSELLKRAADRYDAFVGANASSHSAEALQSCTVSANSTDESLRYNQSYEYALSVQGGKCAITGDTIYGAIYGMETFFQLAESGSLPNTSIEVHDFPSYQHRGVMVDSGRRFWPVDLVKNIMDTMSFNKMNVLHLHASDMCRFGVESQLLPELTSSLTGIKEGFYTAADVRDMVGYARDRGIVVIPEFDTPGHAAGLLALADRGVEFCNAPGTSSVPNWCTMKVKDDADGNKSAAWKLMPQLALEMLELFGSEVYHLGGDEVAGDCSKQVSDFFAMMRSTLEGAGATTMGWGGANQAINQRWGGPNASVLATAGILAVETAPNRFYVSGGKSTPKVSGAWCDLGFVPAENRSFLLGGEVAMWTDAYCYINDCVRPNSQKGSGHELFNRSNDELFGRSVGGMIWPRGHLAAGSFWNFRPDLSNDDVSAQMNQQNRLAEQRGGLVCPTGCECTVGKACGTPYIQQSTTPHPPTTSAPPTPTPTTCEWHTNTGLGGGDFHVAVVEDKEACCALCLATEHCAAADFAPANGNLCHLKHAFNPVNRSDGSVACVPSVPTLV